MMSSATKSNGAGSCGRPSRLSGQVISRLSGKIGIVARVCTAIAAATIGFAPSAHANPYSVQFQSPSGDISCNLVNAPPDDLHSFAKNFVQCDIANHSWVPPQPPPPDRADATSTFLLNRGETPIVGYSPGTVGDGSPMLDAGQTPHAGSIACHSEQSAIHCADTSTGHFFRVSPESYELG
jgi:hypothetical protein